MIDPALSDSSRRRRLIAPHKSWAERLLGGGCSGSPDRIASRMLRVPRRELYQHRRPLDAIEFPTAAVRFGELWAGRSQLEGGVGADGGPPRWGSLDLRDANGPRRIPRSVTGPIWFRGNRMVVSIVDEAFHRQPAVQVFSQPSHATSADDFARTLVAPDPSGHAMAGTMLRATFPNDLHLAPKARRRRCVTTYICPTGCGTPLMNKYLVDSDDPVI